MSKYNNPQVNYQLENFNMIENTDLQDDLKDCNPTNPTMKSIEIKKSESLIHYKSPRKNQVHSRKSSSLAEQILKPVRNSSSYLRGPIEFTLGIEEILQTRNDDDGFIELYAKPSSRPPLYKLSKTSNTNQRLQST